jgi:hypothetical protein
MRRTNSRKSCQRSAISYQPRVASLGSRPAFDVPNSRLATRSLGLLLIFLSAGLAFAAAAERNDLTPRVGAMEIFGERAVPQKKIREVLGLSEGSPLPPSRGNLEDKLSAIHGVVAARLEVVCCDRGKTILYVGILEHNAPHIEFHPSPTGDQALPEDLQTLYRDFLDLAKEAARQGSTEEDLTNGYSLMAFPDARSCQRLLQEQVEKYVNELHEVVRKSGDDEQRAAAAYLLQYVPRESVRAGQHMVDDLQYALQDPSETVRASAMRALKAVRVGAKLHPEQSLTVLPTWYVELLNSVVWSDRRGASLELVELTESRDPGTLAEIRERAIDAVAEMARWQDLEHALPPFILAGRLAGLSEADIQAAWIAGNREAVIKKAIEGDKKPSLPARLMQKVK